MNLKDASSNTNEKYFNRSSDAGNYLSLQNTKSESDDYLEITMTNATYQRSQVAIF